MSAQVIDFATAVARKASCKSGHATRSRLDSHVATGGKLTHDFMFWSGASGTRYVHTIYTLHECPDLPNANVLLVRRDATGQREIVHIGTVEHDSPSWNLAEIRHTAAVAGANEVHVHLLAETVAQRGFIEIDLCAAAGERASLNRAVS